MATPDFAFPVRTMAITPESLPSALTRNNLAIEAWLTAYALLKEDRPQVRRGRPADYTATAGSTWETVGTLEFTEAEGLDLDLTYSVIITAGGTVDASGTAAAGQDAQIRVQWSTDGGSTFTGAQAQRVDDVSTATLRRVPITAGDGDVNFQPTGDVQVRLQYWTNSTAQVVTLDNPWIHAVLVRYMS